MIDWFNVAANALWIVGLSLALAALSYAHWEAGRNQQPFRQWLGRPKTQLALSIAGVLFCLGLAATSGFNWKGGAWLFLAVLFIYQAVTALRA